MGWRKSFNRAMHRHRAPFLSLVFFSSQRPSLNGLSTLSREIFSTRELERSALDVQFDSTRPFLCKKKKKEKAYFYESNAPASLLSVYPPRTPASWRNCFTREFRDSVITSVINPFVSRSRYFFRGREIKFTFELIPTGSPVNI